MWEQFFENHILERGREYFELGLVKKVEVKDKITRAIVDGSKEYKVEINDTRHGLKLSCDCPYADTGEYCKHLAAVLFYLDEKEKEVQMQDQIDELIDLIDEADPSFIKDFLLDVLIKDEILLYQFKSLVQEDINPDDIKRYKNYIDSIFYKYTDDYDYIDYDNAMDFVSDLDGALKNIEEMVDNEQLEQAFELNNYIFIRLGNQDMDDSDGGLSELAEACVNIWYGILNKCSLQFKRKIFKWFVDHMDGSILDYLEDYIGEILFEEFSEEEFLKEKLIFINNKIEEYTDKDDPNKSNYRLGNFVLEYVLNLEKLNVDQKEIDKYCKENLDFKGVREYYIDSLIKRQEYEEAIKLLNESVAKGQGWYVRDYIYRLKNLYKQMGDMERYKEELWKLVLKYDTGDVERYKELKGLYTDEEWLEKREIVFREVPSYHVEELYILEGLYDRLIDIVMESSGLSMLNRYEDMLRDKYPDRLLKKYVKEVIAMTGKTGSWKHYRYMVSILRKMREYPGGETVVSKLVEDWKVRFKNRPSMMAELKRL